MSETLATLSPFRVSFEPTLEETVDVQLRWAFRSTSLQRWRTQFRWLAAGAGCVVVVFLDSLNARATGGGLGVLSVFSVLVGALCFKLGGPAYDDLLRRRTRRVTVEQLRPHTQRGCDMELRPEGFWCRRLGIELLFGWKDATVIKEDGQDIEILFVSGLAVVRGRVFRTAGER